METVTDFIFLCSKITTDCDYSHYIKRHLPLAKKAMTNLDSILKSRDFADKGPYSQNSGFSSSHVWMWELDHKEGWVLKNWCFQTVVLEKTLESCLDSMETKESILKEIKPEYSLEGLMLKLKLQYFWPPDAKSQLMEKTLMLRKIEGKRRTGVAEEEMVR